jgi:hypothetical protein
MLSIEHKIQLCDVDFSKARYPDKEHDPLFEARFLAKVSLFYDLAVPDMEDILGIRDWDERHHAYYTLPIGLEGIYNLRKRIDQFSKIFEDFDELVSKYYNIYKEIGMPSWVSFDDTSNYEMTIQEVRDEMVEDSKECDVRFLERIKTIEKEEKKSSVK